MAGRIVKLKSFFWPTLRQIMRLAAGALGAFAGAVRAKGVDAKILARNPAKPRPAAGESCTDHKSIASGRESRYEIGCEKW